MTASDTSAYDQPADKAGDALLHAAAIKQLFEEHNRTLIGFLHARLRSDTEAREVAQEAYVRLLQLDNPKAVGFLRGYLFRIAANLAVDRLRHRTICEAPILASEPEELSDECDPERIAIASEELAVVRAVIVKLPDKCRRAFLWHVFEDQSTTTIAARLGLSDRMIRMYIAQAMAACRAALDAQSLDGRGMSQ